MLCTFSSCYRETGNFISFSRLFVASPKSTFRTSTCSITDILKFWLAVNQFLVDTQVPTQHASTVPNINVAAAATGTYMSLRNWKPRVISPPLRGVGGLDRKNDYDITEALLEGCQGCQLTPLEFWRLEQLISNFIFSDSKNLIDTPKRNS